MNLGIVIGVSDYGGKGDLPACKNDARAVASILNADSKFDNLLLIEDSTNASHIKSRLTDFITLNRENEIEDLVFYFSGHGEFIDNEFYYLASDFDSARRRQTSLENTEVDNLLRLLSPSLTVKIIDACQSGVRYVKDSSALPKYLEDSRAGFNKCYFMFSSMSTQSSYQDSRLSFFTDSLIQSVKDHTDQNIRYKDVIDFVADFFSESKEQNPFFVVQADYTETFCSISESLRESLAGLLALPSTLVPDKDSSRMTLVDLVREDAKRYCTVEDTLESLRKLNDFILSAGKPAKANKLFEIKTSESSDFSDLPDPMPIGKWLTDNTHDYFAKPNFKTFTVKKRVSKDFWGIVSPLLLRDDQCKTIEIDEQHVVGYSPTMEMPYGYLVLAVEPLFENLSYYEVYVVPLVSKTELRLFTIYCRYRDTDWTSRTLDTDEPWETWSCELKSHDKIEETVKEITKRFWSFVLDPIEKSYSVEADKALKDDETENQSQSDSENSIT